MLIDNKRRGIDFRVIAAIREMSEGGSASRTGLRASIMPGVRPLINRWKMLVANLLATIKKNKKFKQLSS